MQRFDTVVTANQKIYDSVAIGEFGGIEVVVSGSISTNAVLAIAGGTGNSLAFEGENSIVHGEYYVNDIRGVDVSDPNFTFRFETGSISVKNTTYNALSRITVGGHATGIRTSGRMTVDGNFGGTITADGGTTVDPGGVSDPLSSSPKVYGVNTGDFVVTGDFTGCIRILNGVSEAKAIIASSVDLQGDFSGTLSVSGVGSVFGITSRNALSATAFTPDAVISCTGNVLTGIDASDISIGVFAGNCRMQGTGTKPRPASGSATGLSSRSGSVRIGEFSGSMTVSNSITAYAVSTPGAIQGVENMTPMHLTEDGVIAAFSTLADSSAYGMVASSISLRCEGTLFAGYLGSDYRLRNDDVLDMLADYRANRAASEYADILKSAVSPDDSTVYSIRLTQTYSSGLGSNTLLFAGSAIVFGDIELYRTAGTALASRITLESGAEVFGGILTGDSADTYTMYGGSYVSGDLSAGLGEDYLKLYGDPEDTGRSGTIGGNISSMKNIIVYGGEWAVGGSLVKYTALNGGVKKLRIDPGASFGAATLSGQTVSGGGVLRVSGSGNTVSLDSFTGELFFSRQSSLLQSSAADTSIGAMRFDVAEGWDTGDTVVLGNYETGEADAFYLVNGGIEVRVELNVATLVNDVYYRVSEAEDGLHLLSSVRREQHAVVNSDNVDVGFHSDVIGTADGEGKVEMTVTSGEVLRAMYSAGAGDADVVEAKTTLAGGEYSGAQLYGGMLSNGTEYVAKTIVFNVSVDNGASRIIGGGVSVDSGTTGSTTDSITLNINADCNENGWIYGSARVEGTLESRVDVGSVAVNVSSGLRVGSLVGGGRVANSEGTIGNGDIEIVVTSSTINGSVFGGVYVDHGVGVVSGTCRIEISGTSIVEGGVFGGGVLAPSTGSEGSSQTLTIASSEISITDTAVRGNGIFGGGYLKGANALETVEYSSITLGAGASAEFCVFGGGFSRGGTSRVENVTITLSGATVTNGDIFGGGYVYAGGGTATAGAVEIVISSDSNVASNIYAGGFARDGAADITVDSCRIVFEGENSFEGKLFGNGYGLNTDNVGFSQVAFRAYDGVFAGRIDSDFDAIGFSVAEGSVKGVVFTGTSGLASASLSEIAVESSLAEYSASAELGVFDLAAGAIDFSLLTLDGGSVSESVFPVEGEWALVWSTADSSLLLAGSEKASFYKGDENYRVFCPVA